MEDSPAEAGIPAAVEDSPVEAGTPAAGVDSSRPVEAGIPAAGVDSSRPVEVGNREVVADNRAAVDNRVVVDNRVAAAGNQVAAAGNQVAAAGNSRPAAASRRKSYRTWHKKCCPGPPGFGNWDRRSAAVCRTRCSISVRGRYWHRTWGILSIAAFHLSITSITICKGNVFLTD